MSQDQLELQEKVNEALEVELKNAKARYGDKFETICDMIEALKSEVIEVRSEAFSTMLCADDFAKNYCGIEKVKEHAIKCAMEAIQVACVCTKWLEGDK